MNTPGPNGPATTKLDTESLERTVMVTVTEMETLDKGKVTEAMTTTATNPGYQISAMGDPVKERYFCSFWGAKFRSRHRVERCRKEHGSLLDRHCLLCNILHDDIAQNVTHPCETTI